MKVYLNITLLLLISVISLFRYDTYANNNDSDYFIVTAYYSPLPNQKYYLKGNFEAEKRLNGNGIRGASGKKVFSGMLAAPKNYKFGTKIYLEGLGVGEVSDRGGAIVNAGKRGYSSDRIDVWMGYGDEGLRRALYWGKRKVKGTIINKSNKITLNYKNISSPLWATKRLKSNNLVKKNNVIDIFKGNINSVAKIKKLQKVLKEMNLYTGKIDGNYNSIVDSVFEFQLKNRIVKSQYSKGAGSYGPKTKLALKKEYMAYLDKKEKEKLELARIAKEKKLSEEKRKKQEELARIKSLKKISIIGKPRLGEVSYGVRELQISLKKLGYFNNKDTAIYGPKTRESIIAYQLDRKIIKDKKHYGAGVVGPKTIKSLKEDLKKLFLQELAKKENTISNI